MDFVISLLIEITKPLGNLFSSKNGLVEKNSLLAYFLGGLVVFAFLMFIGYIVI